MEAGFNVPLTLDDPSYSTLDTRSRYYLHYCKHYALDLCENLTLISHPDSKSVCKLFIMYDSNQNPLRSLIPVAFNSPVLLQSILAIAARHMGNAGQSFSPSGFPSEAENFPYGNALLFKYRAIQGLSQALSDPELSRQDTTVASAFLLIFLDLLESGNDRWNYHLEGTKRLVAQIRPQTGVQQDLRQTVQGIRGFIIRQIYLYAS